MMGEYIITMFIPVSPGILFELFPKFALTNGLISVFFCNCKRWDAPTEEVATVVRERVQKTKDMVDEAVQVCLRD